MIPRIIALIPAHNEAASIRATVTSLQAQARPPQRIIVVCDNCDDGTADTARSAGASVFTTAGNTGRKAGALNQALNHFLPQLSPRDLVLAMDADSTLNPAWLATAAAALERDQRVGAVCGVFLGEPGGGLVGVLQRTEYERYARVIGRRWQALVLSGTGTLFRVRVLRRIAAARGTTLPGVHGQWYSPASITEDDEITLAVKTLGWRCLSPPACRTTTEIMPTWRDLWRQRMRWQKGTLGDLRSYGVTRVTRSYWARQAGLYGGFAASFACLAVMLTALAAHPGVSPWWTAGILGVAVAERTWTGRRGGWRGVLLAAVILPESFYALWQGWLFFAALKADLQHRDVTWGHLTHGEVAA